MTFNKSNTIEADLRDLFKGATSARPAQLGPSFARTGSRIAGPVRQGVVQLPSTLPYVAAASIVSYPK